MGSIEKNIELDYSIKYGLERFKKKLFKTIKQTINPQACLHQVVQKNPELRFPHRKILDFLSKQYDFEKREFREVNLSTIVRECKLGKNIAGEYLKDLEGKGLVKRRSDGYRVWFRIDITIF